MTLRSITCLLLLLLIATPNASAREEWRPLFDRDLSQQWELWYGIPHESLEVPGHPKSTSKDSRSGKPIGLVNVNDDPLGLVKVIEQDGQPVVHISGQIYAGLTAKETFKNYHVSLEFKWGDKKWAPRLNAKRDSGLLLHCTGEHGAFWGVWMANIECQIQEGDVGDLYLLAGTKAKTRTKPPTGEDQKQLEYDVASDYIHQGMGMHSPSEEKPHGEWNRVEAYVLGDDMVFLVNGRPVMAPLDCTYRGKPLTEGKIQLQSEGAEIFFRDLKIRPITEFPESLAKHVRPLE